MTVLSNRLAIDGGPPVRTAPLPWELPGAHFIGAEERALVDAVVDAKSPFRFYGPDLQGMVATLEREWCEAFGHRHALGVSSGSAALSIAMSALQIGPGDEVLIPGYLWVSCASAVVTAGAIPRLVDIDETFCMDPDDLARKIGPHSRAVLIVHMSGAPGRVDRLVEVARAHGLAVIEDCAQASGGRFRGTSVGRSGDIGIFSFQLNKNMTSGEGGVVVTDDDALARRMVALHDLGYPRTAAGRLDVSDPECQLWGKGARMSELAGAMALGQFRKLPQITGAMRSAKWAIRKRLEGLPGVTFRTIVDPEGDSGPFLIATFRSAEAAEFTVNALRAEGIKGPEGSLACLTMREFGLHWYYNIPSLVQKRSNSRDGFPWTHPANAFASDYAYGRGTLPVADDLSDRAMILSIASNLSAADVDDIVTAFAKVLAATADRF
ncbi:DegT/DnrJ/EryC1/StrS aminotransferase [Acuticoccus sediminis]|uniref:DegT/DnrJ/EryC1/StrS aminotransferase n=1 Tax=Acuticoccus sediminis TaxID=2184697 RepID=A0A8B2NU24_9HYPH|nr:DegT/DnrJ/EryC1/StrS family aminotransferase [Acuticoccus sediminis]RAI00663.1 DegT/DnrJ/EryC1/StrS aminotransferase [Acuticoccus sediminis]